MDIYEEITNLVIHELEKGVCPWNKPWVGCTTEPISHTTGKGYSVLNTMMLSIQMRSESNLGREYLTFKQCAAEGGHVKKGEKGSMVVFWTQREIPLTEEQKERGLAPIFVPILRYYTLFEVGQCEGIERKFSLPAADSYDTEPIDQAEEVVKSYFDHEACTLQVKETLDAYYSPSKDTVVMPKLSQFTDAHEYYSTLFHEMVHSTGHASRLNRGCESSSFGSKSYSKEELVAEMGSCFLSEKVGIRSESAFRNSASYINAWLKRLKEDKKMVVQAAGKAEAAVKYIINEKGNQ